jgi:acetyl-CoA carboxylase biotin carboxyl carrier protein
VSETAHHLRLTELRSLLRAIEDSGWEYARVEIDGAALVITSDPDFAAGDVPGAKRVTSAPASASAAAAPATPETEAQPGPAPESAIGRNTPATLREAPVETVTSPTIGLFWRTPKPGAPPFVKVGDLVVAGDTVCIIEVMKLMTHVTAPMSGTVTAIHVENGSMVEHGTALIDIAPAEHPEESR